jgi:F0F1-type ATP synthase assembly protein I
MKSTNDQKELKGSLRAYSVYIGLVFQMGVLVAAGAYGGKYLDARSAHNKPWFTMLGTLLGMVIGFYLLIKAIQNRDRGT